VSDYNISDKAKPVIVDAFTQDLDANSKLDTVQIEFSEILTGVNYADFSLSDLSAGSMYLNA
jgi:hypothetical protein